MVVQIWNRLLGLKIGEQALRCVKVARPREGWHASRLDCENTLGGRDVSLKGSQQLVQAGNPTIGADAFKELTQVRRTADTECLYAPLISFPKVQRLHSALRNPLLPQENNDTAMTNTEWARLYELIQNSVWLQLRLHYPLLALQWKITTVLNPTSSSYYT